MYRKKQTKLKCCVLNVILNEIMRTSQAVHLSTNTDPCYNEHENIGKIKHLQYLLQDVLLGLVVLLNN